MSELWRRRSDENALWYKRFIIYRDLGPDRKLIHAVNKAVKGRKKPIEDAPGAWKEAVKKYEWDARAEAYDAFLYAEQEKRAAALRELEAQEIERILTTDYAAKHERVKALARMAHVVEASFIDENGTINYKYMQPDKLREWRGILDDIAKELGHRAKETRLSGSNGGPLVIETIWGGGVLDENGE